MKCRPLPHFYNSCFEQVVHKEWHKAPIREGSLESTLRQLYQLLSLIHGPIDDLVQKVESRSYGIKPDSGAI